MSAVQSGLEVLRDLDFVPLRGKRVGLLTNPSAVDSQLKSAYRIFAEADSVNLTALFGPEHGFRGAAPDSEYIQAAVDPLTGVPVYSLYGESMAPSADMLSAVDIVVCDLQDIGVRYYTYTWTVTHLLEAAGAAGVEVMILDRPNPLGGLEIAGGSVDEAQRSLVGRFPVPVQHGMTMGELVQMVNSTWNPQPAALMVTPCKGWRRGMRWAETGLPWVPPSPNMPHLSTLAHYPGACLVEGTQLSEGRGTALPFEIVGAPWIDGAALADELNAQGWAGARFRPHTFLPSSSKFTGEYCEGVQVYIEDPQSWEPLLVWLSVIDHIRQRYPDQFEWRSASFDRLSGSARVREQLEAGVSAGDITAEWAIFEARFRQEREPFLLYG